MPDNDPDYPFCVWAKSPDGQRPIRLAVNKSWLDSLGKDRLSSALAQMAGHIHGFVLYRKGGVFQSERVSAGLMTAHALFRGLNRHLIDHGQGDQRHVYMLDPTRDYGYEPGTMPQRAHKPLPKPVDSVFGVHVEFSDEAIARCKAYYGEDLPPGVEGEIHRWAWITPLDSSDPKMPDEFETRYTERIW